MNGIVPRQNFDTILWSMVTVIQTLIGDDWYLVMINCMMATGWYSCFYFVFLIIFGYIILTNLFMAILIGNFEESSLIMRDTKFIIGLQKQTEAQTTANNRVDTERAPILPRANDRSPKTISVEKFRTMDGSMGGTTVKK